MAPLAPLAGLARVAGAAMLALLAAAAGQAQAQAQAGDAELALGRQVFKQGAKPACALCHTLRDADAEGQIGPPLDELKPDAARVLKILRSGFGAMPAFADKLSEAEMQAVARYVAVATGAAR
ncbi:SorU family sulfite dehydrogenase c-type cytochrome subunit [Aquabacterium sp. OR-4]|uniref:SorU family sulfite dehydrogenase c-type cytochrome subunit n=1 Tax=Aquabacterium sp. OR-4 TaxID=2978127 RepID=UPI0028C95B94|nr:cytochrome c [Aquabacterium sp. OR-4]MDT7834387.1 cytochrome c [Aquabacterium sp. OR-4]